MKKKRLTKNDFLSYDSKEESFNGLYFKIVEKNKDGEYIYSDDELVNEEIYYYISRLLDKIKNRKLREKINERISNLKKDVCCVRFLNYHSEGEKLDGRYFKIVEKNEDGEYIYSDEYLEHESIYYCIVKYFDKIQNEELRNKLKERIYNYMLNGGLSSLISHDITFMDTLDISEYEKLLVNEINRLKSNIDEKLIHGYVGNVDFSTVFELLFNERIGVDLAKKYLDQIFKYLNVDKIEMINKCIDNGCVQNNIKFIERLNTELLVEIKKRRKGLYDEMIKDFKYPILDVYKKIEEVNGDANYIYNKSQEKFSGIRIGIDPRISIGAEIELNYLFDMGLKTINQRKIGNYVQSWDATVVPGDEFISPIMHDDGSDIGMFCAFMDTLKETGYYYDKTRRNAAGQINLGLDYLDTKEAVLNFFEIFSNAEDLLIYISQEKDTLIRQNIRYGRFRPIAKIIGKREINELLNREDILKLFYVDRNHDESINKLGFSYKHNTVCVRDLEDKHRARLEIRIPNGSVNYVTWLDNIRLYAKIMEVSKYLADLSCEDYISDRDEEMLNLKEELYFASSLEEKLNILMDLLFTSEEEKNIYKERFYNTLDTLKKLHNTDEYQNYNYISENVDFLDVTSGDKLVESSDGKVEYEKGTRKSSR